MEVGRSLLLYFHSKHDNQCMDIIVYPSFQQKKMRSPKGISDTQFFFFFYKLCYLLCELSKSDPKGISHIMEMEQRDPSTRYGAQSAIKLDAKLERQLHQMPRDTTSLRLLTTFWHLSYHLSYHHQFHQKHQWHNNE